MTGGAEEVCHMGWVGFKVSDAQARSSVSLSLPAACESRYRTLSFSPAPLTKTEGMQAVFQDAQYNEFSYLLTAHHGLFVFYLSPIRFYFVQVRRRKT